MWGDLSAKDDFAGSGGWGECVAVQRKAETHDIWLSCVGFLFPWKTNLEIGNWHATNVYTAITCMDEVCLKRVKIYLGEYYSWGGRSEAFDKGQFDAWACCKWRASCHRSNIPFAVFFLTIFHDILIDFGCKELLIGLLLTNWLFVFCSYRYHLFSPTLT